jgi:polar amino acid transport system substrate-binding protein
MKTFILKSLLLFFLLLPQLKANQTPSAIEQITFYTEIYPPANFLINNKLKGISVDTVKAMWKHLNINEPEIQLVPWTRGYQFTLDKKNTAIFTMSKTKPRENLFKWVGPIFHSTQVLITKKSNRFNFSSEKEVFARSVAAVRGDISEISLHHINFPKANIATVATLKQAYVLMESGRVDMVIASIHAFAHLMKENSYNANAYEQVWQVNKTGNYLAFNINTPEVIIQTYQQAFDDIAPLRLKIKAKYDLPQAEY